jgi:hypothetical protein
MIRIISVNYKKWLHFPLGFSKKVEGPTEMRRPHANTVLCDICAENNCSRALSRGNSVLTINSAITKIGGFPNKFWLSNIVGLGQRTE